jgi:hypothetical protein
MLFSVKKKKKEKARNNRNKKIQKNGKIEKRINRRYT